MQAEGKVPVLILSAHAIALGIVRALALQDIPLYLVSYDKMDMAYKSKYIQDHFVLPHPEHHEDEFIEGLREIGRRIGKAVVFPADDATLLTLAKNVDTLETTFMIPTPNWTVVERIINKDVTYSIAERIGIPTPKTLRLDYDTLATDYLLEGFKLPFLIKPVQSHRYFELFRKKMDVIDNIENLKPTLDACREKQIKVTIQEIIPGDITQCYNFNSLFYNGKIKQGFTASKIRMTEQGYGIPTVVRSEKMINTLREYSERLLSAVGYQGYSCIEYKYDAEQNAFKLLEINGRYNRSSLVGMKSGINFPLIEYNYNVYGQDFEHQEYRDGIYYIDEFKDLQANVRNLITGKLSIASFLEPYRSQHVTAVFSASDIKPFIKRASDSVSFIMN